MPELPDIIVYIDALKKRILGERLDRVRVASPFLLRTATPPVGDAEGKTVVEIRRLGKRICIGLGGDNDIWLVLAPDDCRPSSLAQSAMPRLSPPRGLAAFDFANGNSALDRSRLAKARVPARGGRRGRALRARSRRAGSPGIGSGGASRRFSPPPNHTLKRALTDPRLFSGIGNAYSDEILFEARLSPLALTQKLKAEQIERLFDRCAHQSASSGPSTCDKNQATSFPRKSQRFALEWRCTAATRNRARAAGQKSSAYAMRPTKPTIVRTARPEESCSPIARCRACCGKTGRGLRTNLRVVTRDKK